QSIGGRSSLLQANVTESNIIIAARSGYATNLVSDGMDDTSGQYAGVDRFYFVSTHRDIRKGCVFVTQLREGDWKTRFRAVIDVGPAGAWDSKSIYWISVLPPGEINREWR